MNAFDEVCRFVHRKTAAVLRGMPDEVKENAVEIVMRKNSNLYIVCPQTIRFVDKYGKCSDICKDDMYSVSASEVQEAILRACGYSMYAHKDELLNGFISLGNGCRMTLSCNNASIRDALFDLSSVEAVRIRIARERNINTDFIFDDCGVNSVLIVGPPASGKTTLLRNVCKVLADGSYGRYYKVCVVDERNELYPNGLKRPPCADVLSGIQKAQGINRAVRLCNPEIIICDEIGTTEEAASILQSLNCGVHFICSMHAKSVQEIYRRECFQMLLNAHVFERIVLLQGADLPGKVKDIINLKEEKLAYCGTLGN